MFYTHIHTYTYTYIITYLYWMKTIPTPMQHHRVFLISPLLYLSFYSDTEKPGSHYLVVLKILHLLIWSIPLYLLCCHRPVPASSSGLDSDVSCWAATAASPFPCGNPPCAWAPTPHSQPLPIPRPSEKRSRLSKHLLTMSSPRPGRPVSAPFEARQTVIIWEL